MLGGKADRQERQEILLIFYQGKCKSEQSTGQKQVKEDGGLSNEELEELTQFLQLEDITEMENGTEIFQQML